MEDQAPSPPPTYIMPSINMTEGLLQQQIDASTTIDEIENTLQGRKLEFKNNAAVWSEPDPNLCLINERGVARLCFDLRPRLTKVFQLSIFDDEQIEALTIALGKTVNRALFEHWDEWEVASVSAASQISGLITDSVYSTLRKAHFGKYLRSISTSQSMQEVQHISQQQAPPKSSLMQSFPVFGKYFKG